MQSRTWQPRAGAIAARYSARVSQAERQRWNQRWRERASGGEAPGEPSRFLVGLDPLLPRRGRALDLAAGAGRHALWLAARGLDTTAVDISDEGLALAARAAAARGLTLHTVCADLEVAPPPAGPWDLVLCFHYLQRPLLAQIPPLLGPGGWFLFCQPTRSNLQRHPRPGLDHLLDDGELAAIAAGLDLEVVRLDEGWLDEDRHEARLVARRRSPA